MCANVCFCGNTMDYEREGKKKKKLRKFIARYIQHRELYVSELRNDPVKKV